MAVSSGDDYSPIERSSVAEQVAGRLLELVRTKSLKPGDPLPTERELAAMMQVSRPSVREAVRGLQILGVLKVRQGHGIYVSSLEAGDLLAPLQFLITLNARNVDALYEARVMVEGGIARLAADRLEDDAIKRLRQMLDVQRELVSDPLGFRVSDMEFHRTIMEATDNPFLARTGNSFYVLGMEYRRIASETPGVLKQSIADHEGIVAALEARDGEASARAMEQHMRNVCDSTRDAMENAR